MTTATFSPAPEPRRGAVVFGPAVVRRDGPQKVLWLDPDEAGVQPGVQMLRRQGLEVVWTASATEAALTAEAGGCDLVVLETTLGEEDGLALCRQFTEAARLPVLVFSAR